MLKIFQPSQIATKMIRMLIVFSSLITLITTGVQLWTEYGRDVDSIEFRFNQVERGYLESIAENVWQSDVERQELLVKGIIEFPDFKFATVRKENGQQIASAGHKVDENTISKVFPLLYTYRGEQIEIGELEVVASLADVYDRTLSRFGLILLSNAIKTLMVAVFMFGMMHWLLARHLDTLARFARSMDLALPEEPIKLDRGFMGSARDELDQLVDSLNDMQHTLRQAHVKLEEQVSNRTQSLTDEIVARKHIQETLIQHRNHLEDRVNERTAEVKEKAYQLERALHREKEYNVLQQKFVSLVSHEFRTPLSIIDSAAQRLIRRKGKLDDGEVEARANKVRAAVTRMIGLIDTTLYASRLDAGKIELKMEPCDIGELLLDVCERQSEISPTHQIRASLEDLPSEIVADRRLLDQVFTNLLSNATKYSPDSPLIEIRGWNDGKNALVTITDQGLGIPAHDLPHMFGRFFRATTAKGIHGTGIGLSVVKEFVQLHGGTVGVDSLEGEGSTFTVRLPISRQAHPNIGSQ